MRIPLNQVGEQKHQITVSHYQEEKYFLLKLKNHQLTLKKVFTLPISCEGINGVQNFHYQY